MRALICDKIWTVWCQIWQWRHQGTLNVKWPNLENWGFTQKRTFWLITFSITVILIKWLWWWWSEHQRGNVVNCNLANKAVTYSHIQHTFKWTIQDHITQVVIIIIIINTSTGHFNTVIWWNVHTQKWDLHSLHYATRSNNWNYWRIQLLLHQ